MSSNSYEVPIYVKAVFRKPRTCNECPMIGYNLMCRNSLVPTPSNRNEATAVWCELQLDEETNKSVRDQIESMDEIEMEFK
jgi:hypothetical protein